MYFFSWLSLRIGKHFAPRPLFHRPVSRNCCSTHLSAFFSSTFQACSVSFVRPTLLWHISRSAPPVPSVLFMLSFLRLYPSSRPFRSSIPHSISTIIPSVSIPLILPCYSFCFIFPFHLSYDSLRFHPRPMCPIISTPSISVPLRLPLRPSQLPFHYTPPFLSFPSTVLFPPTIP